MDQEREIRRLFDEALDVPAAERPEWLAANCPDPTLRAKVLRLLLLEPGTSAPESPSPALAGTVVMQPGLSPGAAFDGYEIIREIGRGSMGAVFLAREVALDRLVALKVVAPPTAEEKPVLERFQREARILAKLNHQGIVPVFHVGEKDRHHYIAMAYVPGETLLSRLIRERAMREAEGPPTAGERRARELELARMLAEVAEALDHAHRAHVVHRDVKPSNIIIDWNRRPHLTDFGIARDMTKAGLTVDGGIIGTCRYMSPEQARASREEVDGRSDVFSLGVVLYEAIALRPPFDGETVQEILGQVIEHEPRRLSAAVPGMPRDLETIVHKALEKLPQHRYQSAGQLAADLLAFADGKPILARRLTMVRRAREAVKRHRVPLAVAATLVLGLGLGAWWQFWLRNGHADVLIAVGDPPLPADITIRAVTWRGEGDATLDEVGDVVASLHLPARGERRVRLDPGAFHLRAEAAGGAFGEAHFAARAGGRAAIRLRLVDASEAPPDMVEIPASGSEQAFWIDLYEVSNRRYKTFLDAQPAEDQPSLRPLWWGERYDEAWDDLPVTGITWEAAARCAAWERKRLPTRREWERAVQGGEGRAYPWPESVGVPQHGQANAFTNAGPLDIRPFMAVTPDSNYEEAVQAYLESVLPVNDPKAAGRLPEFADRTPEGILHLYGNVMEWTASVPPDTDLTFNDEHLAQRIIKGKAWAERLGPDVTQINFDARRALMGLGFRCARSKGGGGP